MKIKNLEKIAYTIKLYDCWRKCKGFKPFHVELLVSSRCNLRCIMCNVWKLTNKKPERVNDELTTQDYTDLFKELSEMGTQKITLSGGEPTLRRDIIDIIKSAKKEGFQVEMITNGTLITKTLANDIVKSGLDEISFSIDGSTPEIHEKIRKVKGGWRNATRGVKLVNRAREMLDSKKPIISINYIVSRINYQDIDGMINLKSRLGYDMLCFNPIIKKCPGVEKLFLKENDLKNIQIQLDSLEAKFRDVGLPTSSISPLIRISREEENATKGRYAKSINKKILCFAPWKMATIDPFGNVYPCCFACTFQNLAEDLEHGFWGKEDFCMGSIKNKSFNEVWNGERYIQFRRKCKEPPSFPMCEWCNYISSSSVILTGFFKERALLFKIVFQQFNHLLQKAKDYGS